MRLPQIIPQKIYDLPGLLHQIRRWRVMGKTVSFTNGCFDILHQGHIASLSDAAREADYLIVGVNSDSSTCRLKGPERPINNQDARALLLASLLMVDAVIIFEEDTPLNLINAILPDVLVKGGDYTLEQIVGAKEVTAAGGRVVINKIVDGYSTTGLIGKIRKL
ncbi:MAG TPA: D-glycero-beta-D-manno-heptose 1-phosphate adenylyltransferase [Puia sp.]|jgi:D-beta-D-heptose 7-phosphate kinase/D-beta-D-heptose 1-phosphate adenosyltransferase